MTRLEALIELRDKVEAGKRGDGLNTSACFDAPMDMEAVDAFDGSLNAALSLMKAVLPGWVARIDVLGNVWLFDYEPTPHADLPTIHTYVPGNPARAWLLAIIKALVALKEARDD